MKLVDAQNIVSSEMELVEKRIAENLSSGIPYVDECVAHSARNRGKRIRPLLLLLSGRIFGGIKDSHIDAACAVELLHTATLLHDDVIDKADTRRKIITHNAKFGDKTAVIFGDYMLSCALEIASHEELIPLRNVITKAAKDICAGEMLQIARRYDVNITRDDYFHIIEKKTATLFAVSCQIGAALSKAPDPDIKKMHDFGMNIGIAFQIIDDLIDVFGVEKDAGKNLKADLKKGEYTLPYIRLLTLTREVDSLKNMFDPKNIHSFTDELTWLLEENECFEYSYALARDYSEKALSALKGFEEKDGYEEMHRLVRSVVDIKKFPARSAQAL